MESSGVKLFRSSDLGSTIVYCFHPYQDKNPATPKTPRLDTSVTAILPKDA